MKYTPLDIQRREFERAFRGLDEGDVRSFLHEIAGEWEEILTENQKLRNEILDLRDRLNQYHEQDRIFKETLLQAQRSREDMLEATQRERSLILKEAEFRTEEMLRGAAQQVAEMEVQLRQLKLERVRFLQDMDALVARTQRFLQQEAPEAFPVAEVTRKLDDLFLPEPEHPPVSPRPMAPRPPAPPLGSDDLDADSLLAQSDPSMAGAWNPVS